MAPDPIPTTSFSTAKAKLSDLVGEAVHRHLPVLIDRHRGKERVVMMDVDSVLSLLRDLGVRFEARVSVSEGEFVGVLPQLQIVAGGPSFEEAMDDLVDAVEEYADDFFSRIDFYRETDRWEHAPLLLLFALTPEDERRGLLIGGPETPAETSWAVIQTGEPVDRAQEVPQEPAVAAHHPAWVVAVLTGKLHLSHQEIAQLSPEEAQEMGGLSPSCII